MDLGEAYQKLMERHRELQEKLGELAALAESVARAQHQFRRVETEKYQELCQELEATLDDYAHARNRFGRLLEGQ